MSLGHSFEEKIQIVLLYAKYENIQEVKWQSKNHFSTPAPFDEMIPSIVKKFEETVSFHDRERSGRSRSVVTEEAKQDILKMMQEPVNIPIRQGAGEINMTRSSYHRAIEEAGLRPF